MHICHEEVFAFLSIFTGSGALGMWLKSKWYAHRRRCQETRTCGQEIKRKEA
jgi:hypothetical protein